ncbi:hypothetical protein AALP_AA2G134600 [Arabis alpina]|nr:hypothetical protein AALP_AA2G134600 [Arabis alpina]
MLFSSTKFLWLTPVISAIRSSATERKVRKVRNLQ